MRQVVRVRVYGRVQGVWYRGWTVDAARARDLSGWVRNRKDGTVEAVFAGALDKVADMIEACRQGPPLAQVDALERFDAADEGWPVFSQLPTTE